MVDFTALTTIKSLHQVIVMRGFTVNLVSTDLILQAIALMTTVLLLVQLKVNRLELVALALMGITVHQDQLFLHPVQQEHTPM
jgi:hypothetical protein